MVKLKYFISLFVILCFASCIDCDQIADNVSSHYAFCIKGTDSLIQYPRCYTVSGINQFGKNDTITIEKHYKIDEHYQIGDSIIKKKGNTFITLVRGDSVITVKMYCSGKVMP